MSSRPALHPTPIPPEVDRWNWGASVDQTPYVWRSYTAGVAVSQGVPVYVENESRYLQIDRSVGGLISYPFSRAMRVDFSGGGRNIGYKQDIKSRTYDFNSGQQIAEDTTELPSPDDLLFAEGSAALVFDTSIMGATSPIRGSRYRLELGNRSLRLLIALGLFTRDSHLAEQHRAGAHSAAQVNIAADSDDSQQHVA